MQQFKCQKCGQLAVVHLTELATNEAGQKQTIELHLCADHAVQAGIISPLVENLSVPGKTSAIVPAKAPRPEQSGMVHASGGKGSQAIAETLVCPRCGMTWHQFKSGGLMGCPQDYALFEARLTPVIRRAQEGGVQHAGKTPPGLQPVNTRDVNTVRLRRQLQQALEAEDYEQAARLRDALKNLA